MALVLGIFFFYLVLSCTECLVPAMIFVWLYTFPFFLYLYIHFRYIYRSTGIVSACDLLYFNSNIVYTSV